MPEEIPCVEYNEGKATIRIEVDPKVDADGNRVSEVVPEGDFRYFEEALMGLRGVANQLEKQLDDWEVDETEVTFGLKADREGKFLVSKFGSNANFIVKLKWDNRNPRLSRFGSEP